MEIVRIRDHSFINTLDENSIVLDCGANHGNFGTDITQRYGCRCWALEPNPAAMATIPKNNRLIPLALALSDSSGSATFHIDSNIESSTLGRPHDFVRDITVETVTLGDLMNRLELKTIDLAKLDIEGSEIPVFLNTPVNVLQSVTQFTVEFHDSFVSTKPGDIAHVLDRLRSIGFEIVCFTNHGHGDLLAFDRQKLGLSTAQVAWLRHVTRNWRGMRQVLTRTFCKKAWNNSAHEGIPRV